MSARHIAGIAAAALFALPMASATTDPGITTTSSNPVSNIFVLGHSGQIKVLDSSQGNIVGSVDTGAWATGAAISSDGRQAFVINRWGGESAVADISSARVTNRIETGGLLGQAVMRPDGQRLYVAGSSSIM